MLDARALLRAGAIVAETEAPADERTAVVRARTYDHPGLPGRTVVRLATDVIAPGVDAEMKALGFSPPRTGSPLGRAKFRALGFPGWALANDPEHARFALEVMQDFKKAVARARSKPGHARDALVAIADRLGRMVPHFLPSFWEEAGRAFLAEENTSFAAQAFEKARQAENVHNLSIDEELRGDAFLEFALAGALAVKSLTAHGKELHKTLGPAAAYPRFAELALRRTLGGLPPWKGMGKELRALATAAKLDVAAEEERLVTAILEAPSITRAPDDLWITYRAALVRAAASSVQTRRKLLHLFPVVDDKKTMPSWWLDLLVEIAALDLFDGVEGELGVAEWFGRLLVFAPHDPRLAGWLERLAPRILAGGKPLQVVQRRPAKLEIAERALALGIALADPPETRYGTYSPFDLAAGIGCDPVLVAADERFGPLLRGAVATAMGAVAFESSSSADKPVVRKLRREWLAEQIAELRGGLVGMQKALGTVAGARATATFRAEPDLIDDLAAASPARALAQVLRAGLYAELTWPELERAVDELGGARAVKVRGAFPHAVASNGARAIVVGPEGRVLEHDLQVTKGQGGRFDQMYFVGDQLLVVVGSEAYWSSRPNERFALANPHGRADSSVRLADGAVTFGGRKVVAGDTEVARAPQLVGDDSGFWVGSHEAGAIVLRELDPETGVLGRASWPSVVERSLQPGNVVLGVTLLPAPPEIVSSPLGSSSGLIGSWRVRRGGRGAPVECVSVDGDRARAPAGLPGGDAALLALPGATERALVCEISSWNGKHVQQVWRGATLLGIVGGEASPYERGGPPSVALRFWNLFTYRDEAGSRALREVSDVMAEELVAAGRADGEATRQAGTATEVTTATRAAIARLVPAISAAGLIEGVVAAVRLAAGLFDRLAAAVKERREEAAAGAEAATEASVISAAELQPALPGAPRWEPMFGKGDVARALQQVTDWFDGGPLPVGQELSIGPLAWGVWVGSIRALAVLLTTHAIEPARRDVVVRFVRAWSRSTLARDLGTLRGAHISVPVDKTVGSGGAIWLLATGASRSIGQRQMTKDGRNVMLVVERATDGVFRLPPEAALVDEVRFAASDDVAWLEGFLAELDARGGAPTWTPAPAAELARRTGLAPAEAVLLWAGLPALMSRPRDAGAKELREALGLKMADALPAAETLRAVDRGTLLALFTAAAPDDPRALWTDPDLVGKRLADAWTARFGAKTAVRAELTADLTRDLGLPLPAAALLRALLDPEKDPLLQLRAQPGQKVDLAMRDRSAFGHVAVVAAEQLVPYLFDALPVGDPYRDALAPFIDTMRARLSIRTLLLPLGWTWRGGDQRPEALALLELVGGDSPALPGAPESTLVRDDGTLRLVLEERGRLDGWAYPAADLAVDSRVASVAALLHAGAASPLRAILFFTGGEASAFAERVRTTPVPAGHYEADARLSAAATVAAAQRRLGLSAEVATLYLQLLALPEPSTKNVRRWNGWSAAQVKTAGAELLQRKLVVEGKREGAGRDLFLPGGWDAASRQEPWKRALRRRWPHHLLFEEAWRRVEAGDVPQLEKVRR